MAGKVVATFQVRVTLREDEGLPIEKWADGTEPSPIPTLARVEEIVGEALYAHLPYFQMDEINVSAERVDR